MNVPHWTTCHKGHPTIGVKYALIERRLKFRLMKNVPTPNAKECYDPSMNQEYDQFSINS